MESFLASVERKAFKMAQIAVGNREDALDIVQDSMLRLVQRYASKPEEAWRPLFFRILQSRIRDWYRRNQVRSRLRLWFSGNDETDSGDFIETTLPADDKRADPEALVGSGDSITLIESALQKLPLRQQQAFLLRAWEELSVAETAMAMNCSEGSVKTHYSRAVHALRKTLGDE